jgi:hypothetical protein
MHDGEAEEIQEIAEAAFTASFFSLIAPNKLIDH